MSKEKKEINKAKIKTVFGLILLVMSIILTVSFISFFFNWKLDQSQISNVLDRTTTADNVFSKTGAYLGDLFIYKGIGIAAFLLPVVLFLFAIKLLANVELIKIWKTISHGLLLVIWLPIAIAFVAGTQWLFAGLMGVEMNDYLQTIMGAWGVGILLVMSVIIYIVLEFNLTSDHVSHKIKSWKSFTQKEMDYAEEEDSEIEEETKIYTHKEDIIKENQPKGLELEVQTINEDEIIPEMNGASEESVIKDVTPVTETKEFIVEAIAPEETIELEVAKPIVEKPAAKTSNELVEKYGLFDPKLELPDFQFPPIDFLKSYSENENITVNNEELESNKNKIVETLGNYGIGITQIKATIGPTVTLYEIVPDAGIRISKIKNLEDDIALSLAALGIRIIAPIPGKGTIGIEVPNSNPTVVSMRSVISSQKFQQSKMELPIVFGKTISNETFVADLAKMPHLLMAGATGQGKSVGLNAVIASLLYKKHPSEIKFVLVDPKKVELTLYNKIERHYLAKLPDSEDAIITDNSKVINTLNSLCIEMDDRYKLLQKAQVRTLKEYNEKFVNRQLNPENGHRYLPYIVLIVDEFADLIMTAGKEVETPIARLAQLARAIGIHLIIATQRPSVNIITGVIKANFPARVAFRVSSKIDSRTILDGQGADQLIGKGDMLYTNGNDVVRLQCAFIDTPEVERITEFVGNQKGFSDAYILPEYYGEDGGGKGSTLDNEEKDELFEEAARVIVTAQQGSTSLIQRKMALGYNRAGRIMDQLEQAGIVGAFEGSKARKVLFTDLASLEQYLTSIR